MLHFCLTVSWVCEAIFSQEIAFLIDECFGKRSPLDSVLKMENLLRSCKSVSNALEHVLLQMADFCLNRQVNPAEMQHMYLFGGKGSTKGKLGLVSGTYYNLTYLNLSCLIEI